MRRTFRPSTLLVALLSLVVRGLPPPSTSGCSTYGCSGLRSSNADFHLSAETPTLLWTDTHFKSDGASCSGDATDLVFCVTGDGQTAAFNRSGLVWHFGQQYGPKQAGSSWPPLLTANGMVATIEGPVGGRRVAVRARALGGSAFQAPVEVGDGFGAYVMPRGDGGGDGLLLVAGDRSSPTLYGFNIEIQLCWSAGLLCANTSVRCADIGQDSVLYALGPPAVVTQGSGHAFFTAALRNANENGASTTYVVRIDVGDMQHRLPSTVLGAVQNASPLPAGGSAPLVLPPSAAQPTGLLLFRCAEGVVAVAADEAGASHSLRMIWRASLSAPSSHDSAGSSPFTLVADPRGGVWTWHETDLGELVRLDAANGAVLQRVSVRTLGLGRLANHPLLLSSLPSNEGGGKDVTLLAGFDKQKEGTDESSSDACFLVAVRLTNPAQLQWKWGDGKGACPSGQVGLLGSGELVYARRDRGGVVALGA